MKCVFCNKKVEVNYMELGLCNCVCIGCCSKRKQCEACKNKIRNILKGKRNEFLLLS